MAQTVQLYSMHAATFVAETVQSCCSCISDRIQAIWNAFCLLITDYVKPAFTWCVSWFSSAPVTPIEPPKKKSIPELSAHYMTSLLGVRTQDGLAILSYFEFLSDIRNMTIRSKRERFGKWTDKNYVLHVMANPRYTKADSNATEDMILLGADPDRVNEYGYTPLHCAVLSGSFLAYKTLRDRGADPTLAAKKSGGDSFTPGTPIELAYQIKASTLSIDSFFWQTVINGGRDFLRELFPENLMARGKDSEIGTKADIDQMIAYEEGKVREAGQMVREALALPLPIAKLIAELGKYYI